MVFCSVSSLEVPNQLIEFVKFADGSLASFENDLHLPTEFRSNLNHHFSKCFAFEDANDGPLAETWKSQQENNQITIIEMIPK